MGIAADFVLIVVAGLCGAVLARFLRMPLLVGYVAAGVAVGPYTAGPRVTQIHDIELLAEIGVALLLFSLGLEVSLRDLKPVRKVAVYGGSIQIVVTIVIAAFTGSRALGMPWNEAVWFGAILSLSSTMIVLKTLAQAGVTQTLASRVMIGWLVLQDLAVLPLLIVLPQLNDLTNVGPRLLRAGALAAVVLAAIFIIGNRLLPNLLKRILVWGSRELFLISVVAIGVGVGFAAQAAGISFALGAFVAGIVLSESEFSHQALSDVVPLRDIFGLLFFVTVGMLLDPGYVMANVPLVLTVVALVFVGKSLLIGGIARAFGYGNNAPFIIGLGLSQVGEFGFVLARSGMSGGALSQETYSLALSTTIITMALSPLMTNAALPLGRWWRAWRKEAEVAPVAMLPQQGMRKHVIVAGYGRSGSTVARALRLAAVPVVVIELDHRLFESAQARGLAAVWGDITREEVLSAADIKHAQMLILAFPGRSTKELAVRQAKHLNPEVVLIARAASDHDMIDLRQLGVNVTVVPEFEGGVEMVRQALLRTGRQESDTRRLLSHLRSDLYGEL